MAAEGILVNGVTEILKRLVTLVVKEIGLATDVKEELEKLQSTLNMILSVMTDAERKQLNDASVKDWMKDLKSLAYEADDILDEFSYEIKQRGEILRGSQVSKLFNFSSKFKPLFFSPYIIGHKIKDINEKFSVISSRRDKLGLVYSIGSSSDHNMNRETYSSVHASKIFGRERDKSNIINMLRMDGGETVSVISIVGMGGLGKTTLAHLVYNSLSLNDVSSSDQVADKNDFDIKMWVCVTQTFNVKRILVDITESITGCKYDQDVSNFDVVVNRLQGHLRGKKFLLVLDDVWNLNQVIWEILKNPLTVGAVGSKIIITTRSQTVASTVIGVGNSSFPAYQLQRLKDNECWSIFTQGAFGASGGAAKTPNLVAIGKELLKRCDGLPLAAKLLGNLLRNKEEKEWLIIKNSEIWDKHCEEDENRILPVLILSYVLLPSHLKQCFSYCSIFPKNTELKRETLIQLWIAEGFIFQSDGTNEMSLKEIGSMYFKSLLNYSFFQDVHDYGETLTCKMHDLVHDLAQSVTGNEECLIMVERYAAYDNMQYISKARRLRVNLDGLILAVASDRLNDAKELRSLFVNVQIGRSMNIGCVIDNNNRLRVLDLSGTDLEALPPSIGNLIHLRP